MNPTLRFGNKESVCDCPRGFFRQHRALQGSPFGVLHQKAEKVRFRVSDHPAYFDETRAAPLRRQRRNAALVHLRILDTSGSVSNCMLPSPIDGSITTDTLPFEIWISAASSTKIRCLEAGMNAEARPATWSFPAARGSNFYQLQKRARSESLIAVPSRIMTLLVVVNFTDDKKQFVAPGWFRTSRQAALRTAPSCLITKM